MILFNQQYHYFSSISDPWAFNNSRRLYIPLNKNTKRVLRIHYKTRYNFGDNNLFTAFLWSGRSFPITRSISLSLSLSFFLCLLSVFHSHFLSLFLSLSLSLSLSLFPLYLSKCLLPFSFSVFLSSFELFFLFSLSLSLSLSFFIYLFICLSLFLYLSLSSLPLSPSTLSIKSIPLFLNELFLETLSLVLSPSYPLLNTRSYFFAFISFITLHYPLSYFSFPIQ